MDALGAAGMDVGGAAVGGGDGEGVSLQAIGVIGLVVLGAYGVYKVNDLASQVKVARAELATAKEEAEKAKAELARAEVLSKTLEQGKSAAEEKVGMLQRRLGELGTSIEQLESLSDAQQHVLGQQVKFFVTAERVRRIQENLTNARGQLDALSTAIGSSDIAFSTKQALSSRVDSIKALLLETQTKDIKALEVGVD